MQLLIKKTVVHKINQTNIKIMDRKKFLKTSGLGLVSIPVISSMLGSCVDSEKSSIEHKNLSKKKQYQN